MKCFFLFALITSVCSWPLFEDENGPDLNLALSSQPPNSSTNSSIITDHTIQISKIVNTTLGGIAFVFTSLIYFVLMRYTLTSSNEIILPSRFLAHNIGGILSSAWAAENFVLAAERPREPGSLPTRKLFLKLPSMDADPEICGIGYKDKYIPIRDVGNPEPEVLGFKTFSPIMRSLIQIAVWNSANFWILLIAVTNTLVYNGFFTNNITTDGIVRLLLVSSYAITNIAHQIRSTTLLYRSFSFIIFQASWTIILNDFLISSNSENPPVLMEFNLQLLGTTERSEAHRFGLQRLGTTERSEAHRSKYFPYSVLEGESQLDKFIKPQRETELKACEKATDSALERALANIAVLVGICLATALAPWTSLQASNSTSAQLGSYAMLLSISTGLLALVSSIGHLSNAAESTRKLLEYQECAIMTEFQIHELTSGYALSEHLGRPGSRFFSRQQERNRYPPGCPLTFWGHLKSIQGPRRFLGLLLGPALMLVPRLYGIRQPANDTARRFNFTVNDLKFSYDSGAVPRVFRVNPNASSSGAGPEVPDQAVQEGTGESVGMEAGGRAHKEADEQVDEECKEDKNDKQADEKQLEERPDKEK